jgi:hypothetical protein
MVYRLTKLSGLLRCGVEERLKSRTLADSRRRPGRFSSRVKAPHARMATSTSASARQGTFELVHRRHRFSISGGWRDATWPDRHRAGPLQAESSCA